MPSRISSLFTLAFLAVLLLLEAGLAAQNGQQARRLAVQAHAEAGLAAENGRQARREQELAARNGTLAKLNLALLSELTALNKVDYRYGITRCSNIVTPQNDLSCSSGFAHDALAPQTATLAPGTTTAYDVRVYDFAVTVPGFARLAVSCHPGGCARFMRVVGGPDTKIISVPTVDKVFPDNTDVSVYDITVIVALADLARYSVVAVDLNAGAITQPLDSVCRPPGSRATSVTAPATCLSLR